jgi:hypothetical protein
MGWLKALKALKAKKKNLRMVCFFFKLACKSGYIGALG